MKTLEDFFWETVSFWEEEGFTPLEAEIQAEKELKEDGLWHD